MRYNTQIEYLTGSSKMKWMEFNMIKILSVFWEQADSIDKIQYISSTSDWIWTSDLFSIYYK